MRGGRVVSERVRREEHEEYESGQSETSDEGEDFERIEYEELRHEEPREYKTKTEESFIEYFQKGQKMNKEVINRLLLGLFCLLHIQCDLIPTNSFFPFFLIRV